MAHPAFYTSGFKSETLGTMQTNFSYLIVGICAFRVTPPLQLWVNRKAERREGRKKKNFKNVKVSQTEGYCEIKPTTQPSHSSRAAVGCLWKTVCSASKGGHQNSSEGEKKRKKQALGPRPPALSLRLLEFQQIHRSISHVWRQEVLVSIYMR